jgi:hypothetical protein
LAWLIEFEKEAEKDLRPDKQIARAFLLKVYSKDGDAPRTCYGATLFGRFAAQAA